MQAVIEFRVKEEYASLHLPGGTGVADHGIRLVATPVGGELAQEIIALQRRYNRQDEAFYYGWSIKRSYTRDELEAAQWFHLIIRKTFEPAGEECGTRYDKSTACRWCGSGARQEGELHIDTRRISPRLDFAKTIADEVVVSQRVVSIALSLHAASEGIFGPVEDRLSTGRWSQLRAPQLARLDRMTQVGWEPADSEPGGGGCPNCDLAGANLLSEVVARDVPANWCVVGTRELVGVRQGLLRPGPVLLCSKAFRRLALDQKLKGVDFEIARIAG